MRKVAVVGAGMAGLSVARLLDNCAVTIYEQDSRPGGLLRCERVSGSLFHRCGGHVFNTKNQAVMDWFRRLFDLEQDFVKARRNAAVCLSGGQMVPYPIENHVYQLDEHFREKIYRELIANADEARGLDCGNFDDFLRKNFGEKLYELYFRPYNLKIWRQDLAKIPMEWLAGKLPMTSPRKILQANEERVKEQAMVHSSFWYPKKDGSQFLVDTLAKGLHVVGGKKIQGLRLESDGRWRVDAELYDAVFFCGNIRELPEMIGAMADPYGGALSRLSCHGTTAVFCQIAENPYSWVYQPSARHDSHRIICTGNFAESNNAKGVCTATVEFTGSVQLEDIKRQLKIMPFSPRYVASEYTPCTYPIQQVGTRKLIKDVKDLLCMKGLFLVGRFAEWEYFNMDDVVASAMREVSAFRERGTTST